jgi:hypothetical protein
MNEARRTLALIRAICGQNVLRFIELSIIEDQHGSEYIRRRAINVAHVAMVYDAGQESVIRLADGTVLRSTKSYDRLKEDLI